MRISQCLNAAAAAALLSLCILSSNANINQTLSCRIERVTAVPTIVAFERRDILQSTTTDPKSVADRAIDWDTNTYYDLAPLDTTTCTYYETNPWMQLDLRSAQQVVNVTVQNAATTQARLTGFQVWTGLLDAMAPGDAWRNNSKTQCSASKNILVTTNETVSCSSVLARFVYIVLPFAPALSQLSIQEVRVSAQSADLLNISASLARQSPANDNYAGQVQSAARALDGSTNPRRRGHSVAQTALNATWSTLSWWSVALDASTQIDRIRLWAHQDELMTLIRDWRAWLAPSEGFTQLAVGTNFTSTGLTPCSASSPQQIFSQDTVTCGGFNASAIYITSGKKAITLAEVQIYSTSTPAITGPTINFCTLYGNLSTVTQICQNGGTCVSDYTAWRCICPLEFQGVTCAELAFVPSASSPITRTHPITGVQTNLTQGTVDQLMETQFYMSDMTQIDIPDPNNGPAWAADLDSQLPPGCAMTSNRTAAWIQGDLRKQVQVESVVTTRNVTATLPTLGELGYEIWLSNVPLVQGQEWSPVGRTRCAPPTNIGQNWRTDPYEEVACSMRSARYIVVLQSNPGLALRLQELYAIVNSPLELSTRTATLRASSTWSSGTYLVAPQATDRQLATIYHSDQNTPSPPFRSWLSVEFPVAYPIGTVQLHNRRDCTSCTTRIYDLRVYVTNSTLLQEKLLNDSFSAMADFNNLANSSYIACSLIDANSTDALLYGTVQCSGAVGTTVIVAQTNSIFLHINEIQVFVQDACAQDPCRTTQTGRSCINHVTRYECTPVQCTTPAGESLCANGGSCALLYANKSQPLIATHYRCDCGLSFGGRQCEFPINRQTCLGWPFSAYTTLGCDSSVSMPPLTECDCCCSTGQCLCRVALHKLSQN